MHCPYCESKQLVKKGFSCHIQSLEGRSRQRFLCKHCQRKCSANSLSINFRLKKKDQALNSKIFFFFVRGLSNRQIALALNLSEQCVRARLERLAKQAFEFHNSAMQGRSIWEPIAYDGLENFAASQYDPNNINHAIGAHSLFIYDFNFAPLNRKGRTSPWQKKKLAIIEEKHGRYNPSAIRVATSEILRRLAHKAPNFELLTDEHFHYKRAIQQDLRDEKIVHKRISSKACRNFQNILFSVNHTDLLVRQRVAAFARETISFSKTAGAMCQKYMLYMIYKNYMVPQFTKKHVRRPGAHKESPAQAAGITKQILRFGDIFKNYPRAKDREKLNTDWQYFWLGSIPEKYLRNRKYSKKRS